MLKERSMTPTVYVETSHGGLNPQTIVKVVWDASHVERQCFATLAEALEFAQSLCERDEEAESVASL